MFKIFGKTDIEKKKCKNEVNFQIKAIAFESYLM